jgi:hypothetical protein
MEPPRIELSQRRDQGCGRPTLISGETLHRGEQLVI